MKRNKITESFNQAKPMEQKQRIAYHEAGHAVAIHLNLKFLKNSSSHHAKEHSHQRIFRGFARFGANPIKIIIEGGLGDEPPNIRKGKTGSPLHFMPTFRVGFQAICINPGDR